MFKFFIIILIFSSFFFKDVYTTNTSVHHNIYDEGEIIDFFDTCKFLFDDEDLIPTTPQVLQELIEEEVEEEEEDEEEDSAIITFNYHPPSSKAMPILSINPYENLFLKEESDDDDVHDSDVLDDTLSAPIIDVQTDDQPLEADTPLSTISSPSFSTLTSSSSPLSLLLPEEIKKNSKKRSSNLKKKINRRKNELLRREFSPLPIHFLTSLTRTSREVPQVNMTIKTPPITVNTTLFGREIDFYKLQEELRRYNSFKKEIIPLERIINISLKEQQVNQEREENILCSSNCSCSHLSFAYSISPIQLAVDPSNFASQFFDECDFRIAIYLISIFLPDFDGTFFEMLQKKKEKALNFWLYALQLIRTDDMHSLFILNLFRKHPKLFSSIERSSIIPKEVLKTKSMLPTLLTFLLKKPITSCKEVAESLKLLADSENYSIDQEVEVAGYISLSMFDVRDWWGGLQVFAHLIEEDPLVIDLFYKIIFRSLAPFVTKIHVIYSINLEYITSLQSSLHPYYHRSLVGFNDLIRLARYMAIFSEIPCCRVAFYHSDFNLEDRSGLNDAIFKGSNFFRAFTLSQKFKCPFDIFCSSSCSNLLELLESDGDDSSTGTETGTTRSFGPSRPFRYNMSEKWSSMNKPF